MAMSLLSLIRSSKQKIQLHRDPYSGLSLYLDGALQFSESHEHRYHECLAVIPMLYCRAARVLICGGGDGLAVTRLLQFPEVKEIVLCDYDPAVTELAKTQTDLVDLNSGSLLDPRVKIIHQDAYDYLETSTEYFDLIICDVPDPCTKELARFFSDAFYNLVSQRLGSAGVFSQQTPSYSQSVSLVKSTVKQTFLNMEYYRAHYIEGGSNGFVVASNSALKQLRPIPSWTTFLDQAVLDSLAVIPCDELVECSQINTLSNDNLLKTYIVEAYLNKASEPYSFNTNYRVITINQHNVCPREQLLLFLRYCSERYSLIVYIQPSMLEDYGALLLELGLSHRRSFGQMVLHFSQKNLQRLNTYIEKIDDQSIYRIESYLCRTNDRKELLEVMNEYISDHGDNYLPISQSSGVMEEVKLHIVCRDKNRSIVGLARISSDDPKRFPLFEIFFGKGSARQNVLSFLLGIREMEKEYGESIYFDVVQGTKSLLQKLGAKDTGTYYLYT